MFDTYSNNMWTVRYSAIDRFQQAARKIIIRMRATKKLNSLKQTVINWKNRKISAKTNGKYIQVTCSDNFVFVVWIRVSYISYLSFIVMESCTFVCT